ncbi:FAD-dependent pyridine nucleotide-disulfide oxidoreductase [Leptolyngbya boryana NIES-2135]|uniref:NADH:ubiquinone reductase (non-electrogenic) n=2 Tax=Leptolyngbya group TaxID=3081713 RepID=A0A1Z4JG09_LEPBY|nr:NAD(P)/FAD-dependent oxidoreductase [Leptolyngbya sp. FACHB-161]MBD2376735.1 NAD(P)/FAD-dependent oxidoreductase [Leptolyngbya sp. FACHB-238]MBD2401006.1 NAD(P)/FAD-dependent oxidoreductase [Leptolyngbya sp. FACHB-239]MBD2407653.1 NAD(P)/FAD-dependent oxidoreductase [Leptolyngbya sp. FACHB-402]BAS58076.1 FAD-dependent pyridine nucleotide-disulfide oxidoreductase [Leptolyngbya boryana IAM M-101]BAS64424.1 FAD-dependent pyridine nucleotide-disulfide oxidoreductase [Leptolyngbya boryana dg5]B
MEQFAIANTDGHPVPHRVVIVGGGFGGLYAAKALGRSKQIEITLIDKRNFHLFQPLLYQVATGKLSPGDISSPLRSILSHYRNVKVLMDEAIDVVPEQHQVILNTGVLPYDTLVVATGVSHDYFGQNQWAEIAPGLKTVEDAIRIRRRIFRAFEVAEKETDPEKRRAWLTFVVVGAGPTGVELAGALGELAHYALKHDFRNIDTRETQILLLEGLDRVLPPYPPELSTAAAKSLENLGVTVHTQSFVTGITEDTVTVRHEEQTETIQTKTVLWAAGVRASGMGKVLAERTDATLDRVGRVIVNPDLSVPGQPDIFVVGDLAHYKHQGDQPLPGVAPVAMQEGAYIAKLIRYRLQGRELPSFHYSDVGSLAVIGQNAAVVNLGWLKLSGFLAWLIWVFAHIYYLIEFDNKLVVMIQWAWNYFSRKGGSRLITQEENPLNHSELGGKLG